jgi:hypothetical protein
MSWFADPHAISPAAKGAPDGAENTGLDEVMAHVERELGVSDWQLVTQENLDAFAQ